jgi:succinate dehydrogenase/fumarate reductase flavoprotein subunit
VADEIFARMQRTAWECVGVIRTGHGMRQGLEKISRLQEELASLEPVAALEGVRHQRVAGGLLVLRCILEAGLCRTESRGAFFREDYPDRDDQVWRRSICVRRKPNGRLFVEPTAPQS